MGDTICRMHRRLLLLSVRVSASVCVRVWAGAQCRNTLCAVYTQSKIQRKNWFTISFNVIICDTYLEKDRILGSTERNIVRSFNFVQHDFLFQRWNHTYGGRLTISVSTPKQAVDWEPNRYRAEKTAPCAAERMRKGRSWTGAISWIVKNREINRWTARRQPCHQHHHPHQRKFPPNCRK